MARCSHGLLAERFPIEKIMDYGHLLLQLYVEKLNNPDLLILRALRAHSGQAKSLQYEMQWMTTLELTSYPNQDVNYAIPDWKLLQTYGVECVCRVDCQNISAAYTRKVSHLKRLTIPAHHRCTIILAITAK